ncbi:DUF4365 domain-containing protein [Polyangium fumosum]|uniref:DUF4365 domain-containing protein n=1 Tax=Polyangium fumosum TaxID=889272 RepID=A0A4U1JC82_9BACT|nr:DUF4365 domain-containing protein [Polyangium fumosum]TKD07903.1 DUF4365 domain-containing protein [Polyangium fumosum]
MGTGKRRRFGEQDQLGLLAEDQFFTRLTEVGWPRLEPRKDLGEDVLVQIYDEGVSTGLSFYVQVKGSRDVERRKGKRQAEVIKYPVEVKDLEHWEVQTPLVLLVVWDVGTQQGYWETVPRLVKTLDKKGKGWRKKGEVTVEVPVAQRMDDVGVHHLRREVANYWVPLVAGKGPFRLTLSFPKTEQGMEMLRRFKHGLDRGERIVFEGEAIPGVITPEWHQRLYGDDGVTQQLVIEPKGRDELTPPVSVEIQSGAGIAVIPYVELLATTRGRKLLRLSNEHQEIPWQFVVSTDEHDELTLKFTQKHFGRTVQEAKEATAFLLAASSPGGRIRIRDFRSKEIIFQREIPTIRGFYDVAKERQSILDKLSFIEPWIEKFGPLNLRDGVRDADAKAIGFLYDIRRDGKTRRVTTLSGTVTPDSRELPTDVDFDIVINVSKYDVNFFDLTIPVGRVKETVQDKARFVPHFNQAIAEAKKIGQPVPVQIDDLPVIVECLDWPPPHDRLYDIASIQSGYFTLAQALEAGFTSADQLQIEERVESYAGGKVFRLVQFPPTNEHEDLVVTWLLTDKKAVFSHDTALALHELSDILPARQHITLPPGYEMPEGVELGPRVAVYDGVVDPSEITWMGPTPFTKPLRTLRDCIEKHLSPDLIDQAIEDALTRGLISRTEAQSLQAMRVKSA